MLIVLIVTCQICTLDTHPVPVLLAQVFRPLWPFFAASGITYFLVSKAQDVAVRCELSRPKPVRKLSQLTPALFFSHPLAEGFRNDPRNPYAAQIAKEEHH
jgi:F-type H+-transporting ATPase subunit j